MNTPTTTNALAHWPVAQPAPLAPVRPLLTPRRGTAAMLTVVACLLAANLFLGWLGVGGPSAAMAEPTKTLEPPFNAAEQRRQNVEQLNQILAKLAAIETKLDKGISVKVTEMPAVKVASMPKAE